MAGVIASEAKLKVVLDTSDLDKLKSQGGAGIVAPKDQKSADLGPAEEPPPGPKQVSATMSEMQVTPGESTGATPADVAARVFGAARNGGLYQEALTLIPGAQYAEAVRKYGAAAGAAVAGVDPESEAFKALSARAEELGTILNDLKATLDAVTPAITAAEAFVYAQMRLNGGETNLGDAKDFGTMTYFIESRLQMGANRREQMVRQQIGGGLGTLVRESVTGFSGR